MGETKDCERVRMCQPGCRCSSSLIGYLIGHFNILKFSLIVRPTGHKQKNEETCHWFTSCGPHCQAEFYYTCNIKNSLFHEQEITKKTMRMSEEVLHQCGIIVNIGKWLGRPVTIKENSKQTAEIYVGRSLTLHIFCFMLRDWIM